MKRSRQDKRKNNKTEKIVIRHLQAPDSVIVRLNYRDNTISAMNPGGTQFAVRTMRLNDAWDPDPALGSGSISGFQEWCNLYGRWRVRSVNIDWALGNTTTTYVQAYFYATQNNTVPATVGAAINFSEIPFATPVKTLGPVSSYQAIQRWKKTYDIGEVYGSQSENIANETLTGTGTATPGSPATRLYVNFVTYAGAAYSLNLNSSLSMTYEIEFFGRIQPYA